MEMQNWKWLNESRIIHEGGEVVIHAPARTDWFNNPVPANGVSDDANGCNIAQDEVWLQIVRVGDVFCTHYSLDGETFYMVRLFHLPVEKTVKVGIEAQSPAGEGGLRFYSDITLENRTVKNLRAGI